MTYNIFDSKAPAMPKPAKGTEFCKLLLSQASRDMHEPSTLTLSRVFSFNKGINWKQNFHPLEGLFLSIGKDASRLWKQIAQIMMKNSLFVMQKV